MPQCLGIKATFERCHSNAIEGGTHCRMHTRYQARYDERFGPHVPGLCHFVNATGRCELEHEANELICMHHRHARERNVARRQEEERDEQEIEETYERYMDVIPRPQWQNVIDELINRAGFPRAFPGYLRPDIAREVARLYFTTPEVNPEHHANQLYFTRVWMWLRRGRRDPVPLPDEQPVIMHPPTPPPAPLPRLQALAGDAQNVHTREVSQQTNDSTQKLLDVVVPLSQKTEQTMMLAWYALPDAPPHHRILRTAVDINKWFNTDTCRQQGDKLYKHLLRGLVAYISQVQDRDTKQELWKRSYEECNEAVGMCCEGHISRLCNVLVGFDEAFQPPVPFSEILQNKMAAISMMDASTDEKIQQANTFFNEYAVPLEQRQAWLDAF